MTRAAAQATIRALNLTARRIARINPNSDLLVPIRAEITRLRPFVEFGAPQGYKRLVQRALR